MEDTPFPELKISSQDFLNSLDKRTLCPRCMKSRKFYCYNCFVPVQGTEHLVPKVKLPLKVDIIKHPNECDGKSTSAHAAVLAPDDVRVFTYPCIPDYPDPSKVVLVFPGDRSVTMEELAKQNEKEFSECANDTENKCIQKQSTEFSNITKSTEQCVVGNSQDDLNSSAEFSTECDTARSPENSHNKDGSDVSAKRKHVVDDIPRKKTKVFKCQPPFERAVFIDSTWNQTKRISSDDRLQGMTCIELKTRETKFWRHQKDNPLTYLSTIEAIYYLVRDFHDLYVADDYQGQYDNLLFFFSFMYQKIRTMYDGGKDLKAYKQSAEQKCENKS